VGSSIPTDLSLALPQQHTKRLRLLDCFETSQQQLLVVFAGSYS
jgi:hypothetical protein